MANGNVLMAKQLLFELELFLNSSKNFRVDVWPHDRCLPDVYVSPRPDNSI